MTFHLALFLVTSLDTLIITFGHYGWLYFRHSLSGINLDT